MLRHVGPVEIGLDVSKSFVPAWMNIIWGVVEPIDYPLVLVSMHPNMRSRTRHLFKTSVLDDVVFEQNVSELPGFR